MDILDPKLPGQDAAFRDLLGQIASLRGELGELRATLGKFGAVYSENGIRVVSGGSITGEGGGLFNWSGDANIQGNTTLGGNLTFTDGSIQGSALAQQVGSGSSRNTRSSYTPPTSWGDLVTTTITAPSWCTKIIAVASGTVKWTVNSSAGSPQGYLRIGISGDYSPDVLVLGGSNNASAATNWNRDMDSSAGSTTSVTFALQGYAPSGMFVSSGSNAGVSGTCIFLRG